MRDGLRNPPSVRPILVCRIAWTDLYRGAKGDRSSGGGAYVREEGFRHEVFNSLPDAKSIYRGYVRPPGSGPVRDQRINLDRLGAKRSDERFAGRGPQSFASRSAEGEDHVKRWLPAAGTGRLADRNGA